jgi:hypothetical protein
MFAIGTNADPANTNIKKKPADSKQIGEERLVENLGLKESAKHDVKRQRENYAASLRKQKR